MTFEKCEIQTYCKLHTYFNLYREYYSPTSLRNSIEIKFQFFGKLIYTRGGEAGRQIFKDLRKESSVRPLGFNYR